MPRPRFDRLAPERRRAVLDTAAAEFAAHGYHEASINRVQAELGLSKGAFYYWFDDKDDLFATAVEDRMTDLVAAVLPDVEAAFAGQPFWDAVAFGIRRMTEHTATAPEHLALLKAAIASPLLTMPRVGELMAAAVGWMADKARQGQATGDVRTDLPAELVASVCMGMLDALDRYTLGGTEDAAVMADPAWVEQLLGLYVDLLRRVAAP
ncbi:MAG: TetR/AcrR family transcriptional regulator [Alphaproteobacteria bacterium]|nr:TetR/AcrR family transcriptional regulator [Alphaproteobacteria bacterium]